ncbi:MAG: GatB/YqeY domain-containing protein [Pseudomonadales bacterium]|jgi:hypothetical protein|nr:GatB/YqeY domain-containing protein [Pseudomonadales bacterium]MDP6470786.1 GatB/YqeY domain-containing protein [Pseudomonadales bacterium]MDP6828262.1 GatB/YqeY domain-containing protein [Pseudomonadales bacterium]MDP6973006.1 GatB/YqeY domain-containing protein [Pseudomonadales bacterium]|tara:strand:- start:528 stop:980 length:453 start_codon:yes stop_codon:yes gene_type:complete
MGALQDRIAETTHTAMKARDKARVAALRLIGAEIKRVEVDERRELTDDDVIAVLNRMLKQRRDSLSQFQDAGREDLVAQEQFEIDLVSEFMPEPLSEADIEVLIRSAIDDVGAAGMQDMGKIMVILKPQVHGKADMGAVSGRVKSLLAGA